MAMAMESYMKKKRRGGGKFDAYQHHFEYHRVDDYFELVSKDDY